MLKVRVQVVAALTMALVGGLGRADEVDDDLQTILQVSERGQGHVAAVAAVRRLSDVDSRALTRILEAMNGAGPLAENWLRGAFEASADRLRSESQLPAGTLEQFVRDRGQGRRARRLAFEWLQKVDPATATAMIPKFIDDPSSELRREAVARLIERAGTLKNDDEATRVYKEALSGAVDGDQVAAIAEALKRLGGDVNLQSHFGLITAWSLIGPFDNREGIGFDAVYPPESGVELSQKFPGQLGEVQWTEYAADSDTQTAELDKIGVFDIAALTAPHKGAVTYATTTFVTDRDRDVEFRLATPNAWKLWVNGEYVFGQEEYHRGRRFDQYVVPGRLRAGENEILLKICQNEQTESWAQDWVFQFRICDLSGQALPPREPRTAAAK